LWAGFKLKVLEWLNYRFGAYVIPEKATFYWCAPKELITDMEGAFDLKFPDSITEIKAARRPRSEGSVHFIIRFTAEPNALDALVTSFPGGFRFIEYVPIGDSRANIDDVPIWFKDPIQEGKIGYPRRTRHMHSVGTDLHSMYIDMMDEKKFVVYWRGYYR
jgi:hypothetical protein